MASRDWGPYHGVDWDLPDDPFDPLDWIGTYNAMVADAWRILRPAFVREAIETHLKELIGFADFPANEADFYEDHFEANEGTGDFGFAETFIDPQRYPKLYINVEPSYSAEAARFTIAQLQQFQGQDWRTRKPRINIRIRDDNPCITLGGQDA